MEHLNYQECSVEDIFEWMKSVSRQRVEQKVKQYEGNVSVSERIYAAKLLLRDYKRTAKGRCESGKLCLPSDKLNFPRLYNIWSGITTRGLCTTSGTTYDAVEISDDFLSFKNFLDWARTQKGFDREDFEVDKDLLSVGKKIYSVDTCCFLPQAINVAITYRERGCGVQKRFKRFVAKFKNRYIGTFDTEQEAYEVRAKYKEEHIRNLAEIWRAYIEPRVYEALVHWKQEVKV